MTAILSFLGIEINVCFAGGACAYATATARYHAVDYIGRGKNTTVDPSPARNWIIRTVSFAVAFRSAPSALLPINRRWGKDERGKPVMSKLSAPTAASMV